MYLIEVPNSHVIVFIRRTLFMGTVTNIPLFNFSYGEAVDYRDYDVLVLMKDHLDTPRSAYNREIKLAYRNFQDALILEFDDVNTPNPDAGVKAPTLQDVKKISDFLNAHIDNNILAVCTAGRSRSGFVSFLADIKRGELEDWRYDPSLGYFNKVRHATPNALEIRYAVELGTIDQAVLDAIPHESFGQNNAN